MLNRVYFDHLMAVAQGDYRVGYDVVKNIYERIGDFYKKVPAKDKNDSEFP
jgi:hypothetical protein